MAPPAMIELSRQTGDPRYRDFALKEFDATTAFLFDPAQHLYYRDSRFFERRDEQQRKMFWSRGNGWVLPGWPGSSPCSPRAAPMSGG
jgi:rhamnogalacturonyl hydrolase YesR